MNENVRSALYVVATVVVGALAAITAPRPVSDTGGTGSVAIGEKVVRDLDPRQIKSLEIQRYDEKLAEKQTFRVAVKDKKWVIPSHGDYPADAQKQLENIAKALVGIDLYEERSNDIEDHERYGVIDPTEVQDKEIRKGVGTLITALDESGATLVKVIVGLPESGKKDDSEANRFNPAPAETKVGHFMRKAGENKTLVGLIDLGVFSTDFSKWIEPDLLQLNAFDLGKVAIGDYAIIEMRDARGNRRPSLDKRSESVLALDPGGKWTAQSMSLFREGEATEQPLADDEELNNEQLNQLKSAIDDLKIVDVEKKPENLNDFVLRFDANSAQAANDADQETLLALQQRGFYTHPQLGLLGANGEVRVSMKDGIEYLLRFGATSGLATGVDKKLNRYLMVTAQFNPDAIPQPDLVPVPPEPEGPAADTGDKGDGAEEKSASEPDTERSEAEKLLAAEREKIKKDNQRKQDEYREKLKLGKAKVKELNDRFGAWFYVIPDDVFRKIHLERRKIVKLNPNAKEKSYTVEAFREMQNEGIEAFSPPPPPRTR